MKQDPIALRTWTTRSGQEETHKGRGAAHAAPLPKRAIVFDTETTTDRTQALLFGSFRIIDISGGKMNGKGLVEGIVIPDDLTEDAPNLQIIRDYADTRKAAGKDPKLSVLTRTEFVDKVLWNLGYKGRQLIVGFNLPFDLSRLAVRVGEARHGYRDGFSLVLSQWGDSGNLSENKYRPRLRIKSMSSKQAFISFGSRQDPDQSDYDEFGGSENDQRRGLTHGRFIDLRTLTFALTDRGHTLESACETFGVEHGKIKAKEHGKVTPDYIDYNRRDVEATGELLIKALEEYRKHPIDLCPTKAYSPASIAKAYVGGMGITPVLEKQQDFPPEILGYSINAYYGGRSEARIRRTPVPVVYTDFLSMYPTDNSLMNDWELLTAERIEVIDTTSEVRKLLEGITAEDLFDPSLWPELRCLCMVMPDDEIFPVRKHYNERSNSWQIGVNHFQSEVAIPYMLPDVIAAKLLSGKTPRIEKAYRFVPVGRQVGLRPIKLSGVVKIDPSRDDFFRKVIEERKSLKYLDLPEREKKRLDKALKCMANSGSYGIFAQMNRDDIPTGKDGVWAFDLKGKLFQTEPHTPCEKPGPYCFPPLAALITSAARLMLALLEHEVVSRGGSYAFCDTDSLAIVADEEEQLVPCPGGNFTDSEGRQCVKALSWAEVDEIVGKFSRLNPYDKSKVPGSVLKIEDENYKDADPKTGQRETLYCYAISAKRYVLYRMNGNKPIIVKALEHGLGHLLNPLDPDSVGKDWIKESWLYILKKDVLGWDVIEPEWFNRPALTKMGITAPELHKLFKAVNAGKLYSAQVKPFNFLLSAHIHPLGLPTDTATEPPQLVAPYNSDPRQWRKMNWIDRNSGKRYKITTSAVEYSGDAIRVKTYGDVIGEYRVRPEHKSLGPDGRGGLGQSAGLLQRRGVCLASEKDVACIGKESNRLEEVQSGFVADDEEVTVCYRDRTRAARELVEGMRRFSVSEIVEGTGLDRRTVQRIRAGGRVPRDSTAARLRGLLAARTP